MLDRLARIEEEIRRLKLRVSGRGRFTVSQTFIVGGLIDPALYVPQHFVGMDRHNAVGLDGNERKILVDARHYLRQGSATIQWRLNTSEIYTPGEPVEVFDDDRIRPQITAASSDAQDLSATFTIAYLPG